MANARAFGDAVKARRRELGLTLREFCRRVDQDPGNFSRLERGRIRPPADRKKLDALADALGFEPGSSERQDFIDLGTICAGRIPEEVLSDEALVRKLPFVFRTCSGRKLTEKQLRSLAEKIRRA